MAKLKITLTGRAPVRIDPDEWPVIAGSAAGGDIAAAILRLDGLDGGYCAIDADSLRRAAIADLPAEDI